MNKPVQLTSFIARIIKDLSRLIDSVPMPDSNHNTGRLLAIAYFWDVVFKHAERQREQIRETLKREGLFTDSLNPGEHVLCESPRFICSARVSLPVRRFSAEELGKLLKMSRYKVPEPVTRELVERAKVETRSVTTYTIAER